MFVLASASPRRKDLLREAGYEFEVHVNAVPEPAPEGFASPAAYVTHVAWLKANACLERETRWILAADTAVVAEGHIIGKPQDLADARRILKLLRNTRHSVVTGVCLTIPSLDISLVTHDQTFVVMRMLSDEEVEAYLKTGLWEGKAGAYGIQDSEDPFVQTLEGSFSNVVGLPLDRVKSLLQQARALTQQSQT